MGHASVSDEEVETTTAGILKWIYERMCVISDEDAQMDAVTLAALAHYLLAALDVANSGDCRTFIRFVANCLEQTIDQISDAIAKNFPNEVPRVIMDTSMNASLCITPPHYSAHGSSESPTATTTEGIMRTGLDWAKMFLAAICSDLD